jgi:hypothetical protein
MEVRSSWWTFAGIMVIVGGFLNLFDGLVAITQTRYIERRIGGELPITNDVKTWGWVALIVGVIMLLAGFGILSGANWARVIGIVVASVNLIIQFAYLDHNPFWSFTMIVIDILIIYGLAGHRADEELERV